MQKFHIHTFHKNLKILAGLYTPGDGYIDPYSLTQGIATGLVATYISFSFFTETIGRGNKFALQKDRYLLNKKIELGARPLK